MKERMAYVRMENLSLMKHLHVICVHKCVCILVRIYSCTPVIITGKGSTTNWYTAKNLAQGLAFLQYNGLDAKPLLYLDIKR